VTVNFRRFVEDFTLLFKGNQKSHGVHIPETDTKEGVKSVGKSSVVHEAVTENTVMEHLHGRKGLGIVPIDHNSNVHFAVIDVDEYPSNPAKYQSILRKANVPSVCFRSKSGGLHIFLFFSKQSSALKVQPLLISLLGMLGLPKDTEVFPKQTMLQEGKTGNWINLPYFHAKDTERYAYDDVGKPLSLEDMLNLAEGRKQPVEQLKAAIESAPLAKAPPCLQTMYLNGGAGKGNRNAYLFQCASYLKARYGEDYEEHLHMLNEHLDDPLPYSEINATIIASHNKNEYTYKCGEGFMQECCNKIVCEQREFGKTGDTVTGLDIGQLTKIGMEAPYYEWEINGEALVFDTEEDFLSQKRFRTLCMKKLNVYPKILKNSKWDKIISSAFVNIAHKAVYDDLSAETLWTSTVEKFCAIRKTNKFNDVVNGGVYIDENRVLFRGIDLISYMSEIRMLAGFTPAEHNRLLMKELDAPSKTVSIQGFRCRVRILTLSQLNRKGLFKGLGRLIMKEKDEEVQEDALEPIDYLEEHKDKY